jgi:hypothetical protein
MRYWAWKNPGMKIKAYYNNPQEIFGRIKIAENQSPMKDHL